MVNPVKIARIQYARDKLTELGFKYRELERGGVLLVISADHGEIINLWPTSELWTIGKKRKNHLMFLWQYLEDMIAARTKETGA